MIYEERPPPAALADVVSRLWFLTTEPVRRYEKILPLPFVHLIVNLSDPYRLYDRTGTYTLVDGAFVSGVQSEYLVIESPPIIRHVGAEFTSAGFRTVTDVSPDRLAGRVLDAHAVLDGVDGLLTTLERAHTAPGQALDDFAGYLTRLKNRRPDQDPVVRTAIASIHAHPEIAIADLAAGAGVSHRALIARFRDAVGVTPKAYAQLWRFHTFVSTVSAADHAPDWAGLAAAHGFYDQPHVIRAFRRFSGWTPAQYYERVKQLGPDAASFVPLDELPAAPP